MKLQTIRIQIFVLILLTALLTAINFPAWGQSECGTPSEQDIQPPDCLSFIGNLPMDGCDDFNQYAPHVPEQTPIKTIRLVAHSFQRDVPPARNFEDNPTDIGHIQTMVNTMNTLWNNMPATTPPQANPISDSRIRFVLHPQVFFWTDSDAWCEGTPQSGNPEYGCDMYDMYVANSALLTEDLKQNSIHIFFTGTRLCPDENAFINGAWASGIPAIGEKFVVIRGAYHFGVEDNNLGVYSTPNPAWFPWKLTHEVGHVLGLIHQPGTYMGGGLNQTDVGFTVTQLARMHYFLENPNHCGLNGTCTDIANTVQTDYCNLNTAETITIQNGQPVVWDVDKKLNTDVVVATGGELIIRCTIGMASGANIWVRRGARLIVDGGTITHNRTVWGGCANPGNPQQAKWSGIRVFGNPGVPHNDHMDEVTYVQSSTDPGIVLLLGATLEYARNAISSNNSGGFGGFVFATGCTFLNNNRTVEFAPYTPTNLSQFLDCEFRNEDGFGWAGITNWGTRGMLVDDCLFRGFTNVGILGYDAGMTIINSTFDQNFHGVRSIATTTLAGNFNVGTLNENDGNTFTSNRVGAYGIPTNRFFVRYNSFLDNQFGVAVNGESQFEIEHNTFGSDIDDNYVGIDLEQTGNVFNRSRCNQYLNDLGIGIDASGNNDPFEFENEDFHTIFDVNVSQIQNGTGGGDAGQIGNQGGLGDAQWNLFSDFPENSFHINTIGSTVFFDYFFPVPLPDPRMEPNCDINGGTGCPAGQPNNYERHGTSGGDWICGNPPGFSPCATKPCYEAILDTIAYLESEIANGNNGEAMLQLLREWKLQKMHVFHELVNNWLEEGELEEIDTLLLEENTNQAKRYRIGLKILQQDYTGAQTLVNSFPTDTDDNQNFKTVQQINLERLTTGETFALSTTQENTLLEIAGEKTQASAYAKSLLMVLTDTIFNPDIPEELQERSRENNPPSQNMVALTVQPNPASGFVTIGIPVFDDNGASRLKITDEMGRIIRDIPVSAGESIGLETNDWKAGIYFVTLLQSDGRLQTTKLILNH